MVARSNRISDESTSRILALLDMQQDESPLLHALVDNGILSPDNVLNKIMASKKTEVLKFHPYAITPPGKNGGRWQTFVKNRDGSRKNIKAPTEEALLTMLVEYYSPLANLDKTTFHFLFDEWIKHKSAITDSQNTIKRHQQHFRKYFLPSKLIDMPIRRIQPLLLEEECNQIVKRFNMSRKEWTNVKTILTGMFSYAVKSGYLKNDPMSGLKISVKYRQVNKKTGKTETYNTDELELLTSYLDQKYLETGDVAFMAVRLNFYLGLRVAELVALKWEDLSDERHLHIVREEVRNQVTNETSVVEHTKTHADRFVPLVPKAIEILDKIPHHDEYIFVKNLKRLKSKDIATVLEKYAKVNGLKVKSTHKIRKTYASMLNANGVPLDAIREALGHQDLKTTLSYLFNPLTDNETYDLIQQAL